MSLRPDCWEQRSSKRQPEPGRVWFLGERDENFAQGWLADVSKSGLSFVSAAGDRLQPGETVSLTRTDPHETFADCETLRVCRIETSGAAHHLVACTRFV